MLRYNGRQRENIGCKILLTADRTVMCDYGSIFYGFLSTAPRKGVPILSSEFMFKTIFRTLPSDESGRATVAPMGLRRLEASLLASGRFSRDDVVLATPQHLPEFISESTKMIGISVIDPLGKGPASSTFGGKYGVIHEEPYNAYYFRKLVRSSVIQKARAKGVKLVVGGGGAWQLGPDEMKDFGIDLVVDGESDITFPDIAENLINGKIETPSIIKTDYKNIPDASQILPTLGPAIGGLVELSRGCGRGCKFCMPNMRKIRHRPIADIIKDIKTNVDGGFVNTCLHGEDVLRYGTYGIVPEHDKVVDLFTEVSKVPGLKGLSVSHCALASIASSPHTVKSVSEIMNVSKHNWIGFQTGIETGSTDLVEKMMSRKCAPFKPIEWPHVVETAFSICHDNNWVPAATLVVNLPGETDQDVMQTVELIENLREYRSFIVPLLFVPFGGMEGRSMRMIEDARCCHYELYKAVWEHDMKWVNVISDDYVRDNKIMTKIAFKLLLAFIKSFGNRYAERFLNKKIELSRLAEPVQEVADAQKVAASS